MQFTMESVAFVRSPYGVTPCAEGPRRRARGGGRPEELMPAVARVAHEIGLTSR
jgi:hypothetical protein